MLKGKIIKNISNQYTVLSDNKKYVCTPKGVFRKEKITPFVGDIVLFNEQDLIITKIEERKNILERPNVVNVDVTLIVTSLKKPDLSLNLLDKLITNSIIHHIQPVICFTKLDLINKEELENLKNIRKYYEKIGIKSFTNKEIKSLLLYLKDKIVVLTGQSGAGKSTLLNKIDKNLNLKTSEISNALNRGVHTTRHTEVYIVKDVWFCDTPGFSSLDLNVYSKDQIKDSFKEFSNYSCKFKDCMHIKEKDCMVKDAVEKNIILKSRYQNYISFISEVK